MGMFYNLDFKPEKAIQPRPRNPYYLSYKRKTTDSGLLRRIVDKNQQRGFRLVDENVSVLNNCTLLLIADGIKQKSGVAGIKTRVNRDIIKTYSKNSKKKLHLVRITFAGQFNKNNVINIEIRNLTDVQLTIFVN